ncbi:UDP-N-acetylmuramoyl-L-alanine--D-glutamate ligase [Tumebacillus permanentifrigoris]|uniref:UDP-N-acetylmuramoylalanine--D-glutamate ligase n=1 Tax=Tumebacillus permanentifrigoris TaxID=378543 RepID=A0A316D868_9BACL|nr:UDP-N-acetylmuramoyl-L-alanine--D-glutamate ligase [Tumebacillus permanentifrigoris]PWK11631.1 UDP-N-acetylmuramoylalanine--D-glutamate ligase [Tumebacillus permanentifrigoris]
MTYTGQQILVLGLARSGAAAARLLHQQGANVVINDQKPLADDPLAADLQALGIEVIGGGHPEGIVHPGLALVVKNPGIPYHAAPVRQALELGIPVITEVELAYQFSKAPLIGITGSNGKTTTTTLVGKMLEAAGVQSVVGGNIGLPLSEVAERMRADQWLVAELSSFQLMGTQEFRPKIGALLNLSAAHLDYHGTFEAYRDAKYRLFANQGPDDVAVLNWDQLEVQDVAHHLRRVTGDSSWQEPLRSKVLYFSTHDVLEEGVFVKDEYIHATMNGKNVSLLPVADVALAGAHNLQNVLAAAAICLAAGAAPEAIAEVARTFRGVEHRTEYVTSKQGVDFYNDSKATNAAAATQAITAFENVVLIAGGLDRGVDFLELVPIFEKHVKHLVAIGQAADTLLHVAKRAGRTGEKADSLEQAVELAARSATAGDTVLLSPACASWDMFGSFEERGSMFKKAVHTL